jgi:sarcosine oxidase, subunit beta
MSTDEQRPIEGKHRDMADRTEIVVIGGGVIGASIAYHLACRGARVTLLERDGLAAQASGASAGGVRQLGRDPREMPLAIASIARWQALEDELEADVAFVRGGQLRVCEREEDAASLRESVNVHRALGVDIQFVEGDDLCQVAPNLAPGIQWGMYTGNDGQASAPLTTRAFGAAAQRCGASIRTGVDVTRIVREGGRVVGVETSNGPIACDWLVLAAGVWTVPLAHQLDVELPLVTMALQMMAVGPGEPVLAPTVGAVGRKLSLKQVPDGEFVIGGGWPGDLDATGHRGTTRLASIRGSIEHSTAILPLLAGLPLARTWIGLEALCIDEVPIMGALPAVGNVTVAAGFSGHGFALSPIVGQLLSELILDGSPSISLDAFHIDRFANLDPATPFPDWQAG